MNINARAQIGVVAAIKEGKAGASRDTSGSLLGIWINQNGINLRDPETVKFFSAGLMKNGIITEDETSHIFSGYYRIVANENLSQGGEMVLLDNNITVQRKKWWQFWK